MVKRGTVDFTMDDQRPLSAGESIVVALVTIALLAVALIDRPAEARVTPYFSELAYFR
jgi:hypothetical protein